MKQHITIEQWDELDKDSKIEFNGNITMELRVPFKPNIGQIIEFLGDNLWQIQRDEKGWRFILMCREKDNNHKGKCLNGEFVKKEMIDAGWEAVKEKFK